MSDIWALQGRADCGKTSTIKEVFNILKCKYKNAKYTEYINGDDIKILFPNVNGHTVGIESQGDPKSRLKQSLIDFENAGCDIIFCACRTSGMTVQWINSHKNKYTIHFIPQNYISIESQQSNNNHTVAIDLIDRAGL